MVRLKSNLSPIRVVASLILLTLELQKQILLGECAAPIPSPPVSPTGSLQSLNISSPFGWRNDPINGISRFHAGIDLPAQFGTPVLAAQSGFVVYSGQYGDYGETVVLDHGSTLYTLYGHNSERLVSPGQYVQTGQPIARVGATGRVTGPHLHFEIHYNKQYLNPADYLESYFKVPLGPMDMLPPVIVHKTNNKIASVPNNKPPIPKINSHSQSSESVSAIDSSTIMLKHGFFYNLFHRKPKMVQHIDPNERIIPLSWDNKGPSPVMSWQDVNPTPPVPGHRRVQMVTGNRMETIEF